MGGEKSVEVWGTGSPRREFLYVDDLADACLYLMNNYDGDDIINVGVGKDLSVRKLAEMVGEVVGFEGDLRFDHTKPDGTPLKLLDVSRLTALGWQAQTPLREGIRRAYEWFLDQLDAQQDTQFIDERLGDLSGSQNLVDLKKELEE